MANLKEIRTRIASVASTRQITSAMKMVAAAKLKKAQDLVTNFKIYAHKMQEIMLHVTTSVGDDKDNVYAEDRDYKQVLIVVITSNRGLCGAFNSNAIKEAVQLAERKYSDHLEPHKIRYMAIGKKGYDALRKRKGPLDEPNTKMIDHPTYENAAEIAQSLMDAFTAGRYDCIYLVYNEFINAATQKIVCQQFLPLFPEEHHADKNKKKKNCDKLIQTDYIFEPSKEFIVRELIPQNLRLTFYEALLESIASEFGARMTSMHQATDNATTLIQELTLQYNKARQAAITNEILEIVGGAEALKG
jgi:F-type H+-transporting ATPase subunit gamma